MYANKAWTDRYGEPVGKSLLTENPGVVVNGLFEQFVQVTHTGVPVDHEHYYSHEQFDGWFHQSTVKLHDGVATTTADITGRKEAEQQLRQNLQQLKQAEQVAQLGSWEYEPATDTLRWSAGMYRLFDLPVGTPVQLTTYLDYVLTEDRQLAQRLMHQLQHSPQAMEETVRINVRGGVTSLKIRATVLRNTAGQPVRVLGVDMDVSEVIRLEQENLRLRLEQQNQLLFAILDAQEEERHRIAESLHNGVGQLLYATKLNLHRVAHLLPAPEGALSAMVAKTEHLLGTAIAETRRVSHELIPILLKEYGLDKALKDFCSHFASSGIAFSCHGLTERLSPYLETAIYRIAQELINNIIKHAQATRARLEVTRDAHGLCIEAQDDGIGLVTRTPFTGIGLKIIEDRVTLLNGTLQLESAPGQGTLITICIPLP